MNGFSLFQLFDIAFRSVALLISMLLLVFLVLASTQMAFAATLRPEAILSKDTLTVGDLFDNVGKNANYVLGPAPQPGADMVLNAPTLLRVALALDLPWTPSSSADQIVVKRAASRISTAMVKDNLVTALKEKGISHKFSIDTGASVLDISLPNEYPATVEVSDLTYNPQSNRFDATISAPSASQPVKQLTVSGSVRSIVEMPVLNSSLRAGDIISEKDISYIEVFENDVQPDMLLTTASLTGMTPRRMVMAGKPVRTIDLQAPQLVSRGENVTVTFSDGSMKLTTMGRALQNGAKGDVIRVVNNSSNRALEAIVDGSGAVTVRE